MNEGNIDSKEKINLIYVLGRGHSGSTLVELLLNALPDVTGCGEIWQFPEYLANNPVCSCNEPIHQCQFWKQAIKRIRKSPEWNEPAFLSRIPLYKESKLESLLSPAKINYSNFLSKTDVAAFGAREYPVYAAIRDVADAKTLVDSSKHWNRLLALESSGCFDIKVVHLVRNGKALLDAWRRAYVRESAARDYPVNPPKEIFQWVMRARRDIRLLDDYFSGRYTRISYQEIASQPTQTLRRVCQDLNLAFEPGATEPSSPQYLFRQEHHLAGGNRMKFSEPSTPIVYHGDWSRRISKADKLLFRALGGEYTNRLLGICD